MKCPRCEWELRGVDRRRKGKPCHRLAVCDACRWESAPYEQLIERSPEYRLAKLKAANAGPGWYGPDGCAATISMGPVTGLPYLHWNVVVIPLALAPQCGFVEVPHD